MHNLLKKLKYDQALQVAYYTRLALDRHLSSRQLPKVRFMQGSGSEPSAKERDLSAKILAQIEEDLGKPIPSASSTELRPYYDELHTTLNEMQDKSDPLDPKYVEELLQSIRSISTANYVLEDGVLKRRNGTMGSHVSSIKPTRKSTASPKKQHKVSK